jgi:hypothetical protein
MVIGWFLTKVAFLCGLEVHDVHHFFNIGPDGKNIE